ncbi:MULTISPECIES: DUF507 family protein [Polyangium]|uniref:DUF507 family protein n=4 Tax=Polyangium TaxID=55 RepID=A0A4U1JD51_9BACT|nr:MULTISPECIES: DUF507 family protein [Polyangium]MDC0745219.1 DUF507 family protein [Polyangium mundeleinium]MDC3957911.1 DUF507 family protein [Polyangium jinanense]MDC3983464.1 DUF507 family protein [Polyangium jinanense]MDI1436648.1 DUF507 family protein [Polyangium sorediatum]MDI1444844.1 DUF507 family protein [Polyangium sp. 6x1]
MRLFSGKIAPLSEEIVKTLADNGEIECEDRKEVVRDLESVFSQYLATEKEVMDKSKATLESRGLPPSELGRIRKIIAEQKGIKIGEDILDYLLDQCIEMLMHSGNVDEVYGQDHDLRRRMRPVLKKYLAADDELDAEVRNKMKNLQEGTRTWEVEYQKIKNEIQRRKGLV